MTQQPSICSCVQTMLANQLGFVDMLDFCEHFLVTVPSKHPKVVGDHIFEHWITPFGVPRRLIYDHGGEFERECGQELENLGCELMPTAAITPQQNAVCERHGGVWKSHARLIDKFSMKFVPEQMRRVTWLTTAVTLTYNSDFDDSGRVLTLQRSGFSAEDYGCRARCWTRLEDSLCAKGVTRGRAFSGRISMMCAQKSITSLRHDRTLSRAVLSRPREHGADPARDLFQVGDVVYYYWRGNGRSKHGWAAHWYGLATVNTGRCGWPLQLMDGLSGEREGDDLRRAVRESIFEFQRFSNESRSLFLLRRDNSRKLKALACPLPNKSRVCSSWRESALSS